MTSMMNSPHAVNKGGRSQPAGECVELVLLVTDRELAAVERAAWRLGLTAGQFMRRLVAAQVAGGAGRATNCRGHTCYSAD